MKTARWVTGTGSVVLFVFGILHGSRYGAIEGMIRTSGLKEPLDGILRASWLGFSCEQMAIAVIALVASRMERGGRIVLLCGALMAVHGVLLFHFLGLFIGTYVSVIITLLFLIGGWLQSREAA